MEEALDDMATLCDFAVLGGWDEWEPDETIRISGYPGS